jgi:hypothetical protein
MVTKLGIPFLTMGLMIQCALQQSFALGPVTEDILTPSVITDLVGTHTGSVHALSFKDQTGTANDPSKYVQFGVLEGQSYRGYRSYYLPASVNPSKITTITMISNVFGPSSATDEFAWSIYNWTTSSYEKLGNQNNCGGTAGRFPCTADQHSFAAWKWIQYNVIGGPLANYINSHTREIRVQLSSANESSYINMDYESISIYTNRGRPRKLWIPPRDARWQWQIQAKAGVFTGTDGINVDVCEPTYQGGNCVKPDVFDIDLYVDSSITGTYDGNTIADDYVFTTDAINAIHASGRHVIGYITVGDAENFRADYQQMVDFDAACRGCFIGNPFSRTFPNEWYVNINNGRGQADFMRKMVQARIDKVAAAGFDSVEPDVDNAFENNSGFNISGATQIAYNVSIARIAHADGLSINLKSDVDQAMNPDLISAFDYVLDEQCFQYNQCGDYSGFQQAGKSIFNAEYRVAPDTFCPKANAMKFNSIKKATDFSLYDLPWTPCR